METGMKRRKTDVLDLTGQDNRAIWLQTCVIFQEKRKMNLKVVQIMNSPTLVSTGHMAFAQGLRGGTAV
jgi:hypothetical protein